MKKYSPPYPLDKIPAYLHDDPVHRWRAENGIELIHEEPSFKEFVRIIQNWKLMTPEQKKLSDEISIKLFGITNEENIKKLYDIMLSKQ